MTRNCHRRRAAAGLLFVLAMLVAVVETSIGSQAALWAESPAKPDREELFAEIGREVAILEAQGNLLKKIVKVVQPSVVHVEARKGLRHEDGLTRGSVEEAGSGIILDIDGTHYVLTNRHVIEAASSDEIKIKLADGRILRPEKLLGDPATDVALMKVTADDLTSARIGDSDRMEIGDFVLAVGSPFGLSHSVTFGIISAKGRRNLRLGNRQVKYQEFFQTDAAINPGNSGGPLINLRGEVIGMNTAIASASGGNEGIGFTIPSKMFLSVARQLARKGHVSRAFLGVHLDARFSAEKALQLGLRRPRGARVTGVTAGSPASTLDLKRDDVIIEINDVPIEDDSHLVNLVGLMPIGREITLNIFRGGEILTRTTHVADRANFEGQN